METLQTNPPKEFAHYPTIPAKYQLEAGTQLAIDRFGVNFGDEEQLANYAVSDDLERLKYGAPVARVEFFDQESSGTGTLLEVVDVSKAPWKDTQMQGLWGNFMIVVWQYAPQSEDSRTPVFEPIQTQRLRPGELYGYSGKEVSKATPWMDLNPLVFGISDQDQLLFERDRDDPATIVVSNAIRINMEDEHPPVPRPALHNVWAAPGVIALRANSEETSREAAAGETDTVIIALPSQGEAGKAPSLPRRERGSDAHRFGKPEPSSLDSSKKAAMDGKPVLALVPSSVERLPVRRTRFMRSVDPADPLERYGKRMSRLRKSEHKPA